MRLNGIDEVRSLAGPDELNRRKEIKIKVPTWMHIQLHSIKVLRGMDISTFVTEALEEKFARMKQEEQKPAQDGEAR